jgi:hypothetical protein
MLCWVAWRKGGSRAMDAGGLRTAIKPSRRTTDRGELHQPRSGRTSVGCPSYRGRVGVRRSSEVQQPTQAASVQNRRHQPPELVCDRIQPPRRTVRDEESPSAGVPVVGAAGEPAWRSATAGCRGVGSAWPDPHRDPNRLQTAQRQHVTSDVGLTDATDALQDGRKTPAAVVSVIVSFSRLGGFSYEPAEPGYVRGRCPQPPSDQAAPAHSSRWRLYSSEVQQLART